MAERTLDPKYAREKLGEALRLLRAGRKISLVDAAARVHRDHTWMSKVERGRTRILPAEAEILLGLYRADPHVAGELLELSAQAGSRRQSATYREFSEVIDADFDPLLRLELQADTMRIFECQQYPAILQSEPYALELLTAPRPDDPQGAAKMTALRMRRPAEVLTGSATPSVTCVVTEGAVRQVIGGPAAMRDQIHHVLTLIDAGTVEFRILPFDAGAYSATNGAFSLFTMAPLAAFAADGPDVVAYQDTLLGCIYYRAPEQTEEYEEVWRDLELKALSPEETKIYLLKMADDMNRHTT